MTASNQALVYRGPFEIELVEIAEPEPGPDDVVVEVAAAGICGSDVHGYSGESGRRQPGLVMGHEFVGRLIMDGSAGEAVVINPVLGCGNCPHCRAGLTNHCPRRRVLGVDADRVGGFARRIALPRSAVTAFTGGGSIEAGALVEPIAVGLHAVRRSAVGRGHSVAVVGCGMVGLAVVWAALAEGAETVFVSDFEPNRLEVARRMGAVPVNLAERTLASAVVEDLGDRGVDRALDAVGTTTTFASALSASTRGGTVCLVGMESPRIEMMAYDVVTEERTVVGSWCYSTADFADANHAVSSAAVPVDDLIDGRVSLEQAPAAIEAIGRGATRSIKTLVLPTASQ